MNSDNAQSFRAIVHPWLCDAMGHLTTRHYVGIFDDAAYHLFHHAFGYLPGSDAWKGKGWADVRQTVEYKSEVHAGELLEVRGQIVRLGGKSVSARYEMIRLSDNAVAAVSETVTAFFDTDARCALSLTDAMRTRAEASMAG